MYENNNPWVGIVLWTIIGAWVGNEIEKLYYRFKAWKIARTQARQLPEG